MGYFLHRKSQTSQFYLPRFDISKESYSNLCKEFWNDLHKWIMRPFINYICTKLHATLAALILCWKLPTVDAFLHDRPLVRPHLYPVHTRWEKNNRARVPLSISLTNVFFSLMFPASSQRHIAICLGLCEVLWAILITIITTIPTDMNYHRRRTSHPHRHHQRRVTSRCSAAALYIRGESHPVYTTRRTLCLHRPRDQSGLMSLALIRCECQ